MARHALLWINVIVLLMQGWNTVSIGKFTAQVTHTLYAETCLRLDLHLLVNTRNAVQLLHSQGMQWSLI